MSLSRDYNQNDKTLYFAYGSNLHVSQMAHRCPGSVFIGKASLPGHRWQINERGVANIVKSEESSVEGLVYLVGRKDQRSLDRSEGVSKGFYQKRLFKINLVPHELYHGKESSQVAEILERGTQGQQNIDAGTSEANADENELGSRNMNNLDMPSHKSEADEHVPPPQQAKALVYISGTYKKDGVIREEYISRMQKAKADALVLGVTRSFIEEQMGPHIQPRETPVAEAITETENSEHKKDTNTLLTATESPSIGETSHAGSSSGFEGKEKSPDDQTSSPQVTQGDGDQI
ncbi:hypothetical protein GGS26DRAFT_542902 [Hypomontagnella submonticulosa]|nr:hypothetical protein GGS26DRAFT_542902 [Hypomontagnella submonticulosa]